MGCGDKIIRGAAGLAKAGIQLAGVAVDQAPVMVIAERRDQCRNCPHSTKDATLAHRPSKGLTTLSICGKCDCIIAAKTRIASESCPDGRWPAVNAQ